MSTTSPRTRNFRGENPCRYGRTAVPRDVPASCSGKPFSDLEEHQHLAVFLRSADSVDTGNAGDDDHIPAFQHGTGCRNADGRVHRSAKCLFRCKDPCGERRLRLVIIVVADEIFDRVMGKEGLEFVEKLGSQGLLWAITRDGRCSSRMTLAMVKVFPEPVMPSSTWCFFCSSTPWTSSWIAWGWSPRGRNPIQAKRECLGSSSRVHQFIWPFNTVLG